MANYFTYRIIRTDNDGNSLEEYTLYGDGVTSGSWMAKTFDELISNYRASKEQIKHDERVSTVNASFGFYDGGGALHKPLSGDQMERLYKEVALKLQGK